mgnify:CR=1 FL=1
MKKYFLYWILNIFFLLITLFCLLYINTYLNEFLLPNRLLRDDVISGSTRIGLVLIEAVIFISIFYIVNQLILKYDYNSDNRKSIAMKTAAINLGVVITIIIYGILYSTFNN